MVWTRDFVILEAGEQEDRQGRLLVEAPVDNSAPKQAGFRYLALYLIPL